MKNDTNLSAHRFLIIAGTSRAGTTSVFNYLARHPQICPADKETRFFLDAGYPLTSKKRYQKDGLETYWSLFQSGPQDNWRFEATPDYLYSANSADAIHQTLPNVRLIFILREPISRLVSWYRFAHNIGELPSKMTLDAYVAIQRKNGDAFSDLHRHPAFYALQHGRYSLYLRRYFELFGEQSIHVLFYEELQRDPLAFMTSVCHSLSIDEAYFRRYRFEVTNKGCDVRSLYLHRAYAAGKERIGTLFQHIPRLRLLRHIRRSMDAAYERLNVTSDRKLSMSRSTSDFLSSYYSDEIVRLTKMLGTEVPWACDPAVALAGFEINSPEHRAE